MSSKIVCLVFETLFSHSHRQGATLRFSLIADGVIEKLRVNDCRKVLGKLGLDMLQAKLTREAVLRELQITPFRRDLNLEYIPIGDIPLLVPPGKVSKLQLRGITQEDVGIAQLDLVARSIPHVLAIRIGVSVLLDGVSISNGVVMSQGSITSRLSLGRIETKCIDSFTVVFTNYGSVATVIDSLVITIR